MRPTLLTLFLLLPLIALSAPWDFHDPLDISTANGPGIFHHLGSGGRFGLALSADIAGVAWEDNRDGVPRCYVALVAPRNGRRITERQVSGNGSAFEPTVSGLDDGRFAVAWEEDSRVWVRLLSESETGPAVRLDDAEGAYVSLAWQSDQGLVAVWSRKDDGQYRIWLAFLDVSRGTTHAPIVTNRMAIDASSSDSAQTHPSAAFDTHGRLVVAWEDRRPGHTIIMAVHQQGPDQFSPPKQINQSFWGGRKLGLGRGTGAMRVSLATLAGGGMVAVWADKRDFRSGYDVYAAFSAHGEAHFGGNEKVQDEFADGVGQWHPSVASSAAEKLTAVVWDDDRDDTQDVWISWHDGNAWSDDFNVPGAYGDGAQVEPAVALDRYSGLHLAWLDKERPDGPSRVRYLYAPREQ